MFNDTIAAIATPPGEGGIGVVRISGPQALTIGRTILRGLGQTQLLQLEPRRVYYGWAIEPGNGRILDQVLFFYLRRPHSFTAEDTVEIQAHGGPVVLASILQAALHQGARLAEAGEFTQRAFLNGRIDLVQAEAILDLIRAQTSTAQELALSQLRGQASQELHQIEAQLYQALVAIEARLDFPEEGLPELHRDQLQRDCVVLKQQLQRLLDQTAEGRKLREGVQIVIIGPPNVGKSSLLNAFLEEERAIVTEFPGTTRDIIDAQIQWGGLPVRLVDTAGLRNTTNPIERIGIAKAESHAKNADLVLLVLDGSRPLAKSDRVLIHQLQQHQALVVINKTDLPQRLFPQDLQELCACQIMTTSLLTGSGLAELTAAIHQMIGLGQLHLDHHPLLSRVRHQQALTEAGTALNSFLAGLSGGLSEDLLAVDLRACLAALGSITGKQVTPEVIQGIFSQFCIGK